MKKPIIDIHVHAFDSFDGWDFLPEKILGSPMPYNIPETIEELATSALNHFKENNIQAVTFGALSRQWKERAPDNIIHAVPLEATTPPPTIEELREAHQKDEVKLLGEITYQYRGIPPNSPKLEPYYELANELDIPILIHIALSAPNITNSGWGSNYRSSLSNPFLLEETLNRYPNLRFCVAHAGYPMLESMIHMLYTYPNLYADFSVLNWWLKEKEFYHYLERLVDIGFHEQLLYGSDLMIWPEALPISLERTKNAPFLTESQKRDILYNNAKRFLKL